MWKKGVDGVRAFVPMHGRKKIVNSHLSLSGKGVEFIAQFEGFSAHWYICPAGKKTIGYGHVFKSGDEGIKTPINKAVGVGLLRNDAELAAKAIRTKVNEELCQHEFDALVSFVYNVGVSAFANSTMLKLLNIGFVSQAAEQFKRWTKAGGKELPGLVRRRDAERKLFITGKYV